MSARARAFIHSFMHAFIHSFMRACARRHRPSFASLRSRRRRTVFPVMLSGSSTPPTDFVAGAMRSTSTRSMSGRSARRVAIRRRRVVECGARARRVESNRIDRWMLAERATTRAPRDAVVRERSIRCDARGRRTRARRSRRGVDRSSDDRDVARDIVVARDVVVGTRWMRPR